MKDRTHKVNSRNGREGNQGDEKARTNSIPHHAKEKEENLDGTKRKQARRGQGTMGRQSGRQKHQ